MTNETLKRAIQLCEWINETPHQRGSINGLAAQVGYELRAAITAEQAKGREAVAWKDVPGYEGLYQACTDGRIKNTTTGQFLSDAGKVGAGYVQAVLWKDGKRWQTTAHRIIAATFLGGIPDCFEVNHKNGVKTDNRVDNLEVVTRSENVTHNYYTLGYRVKPVVATNTLTGEVKTYRSVEEAVRDGFHSAHIYNVINGKRKIHRGHVFEYAETTPPAQPAREWVGLTPDDRNHCWWDIDHRNVVSAVATYGINIEAKLREKNAGQPVVKEN